MGNSTDHNGFHCEHVQTTDFTEHFHLSKEELYVVSLTFSVVSGVTAPLIALGNGLVLLSILRSFPLRTPPNILICSLAIADFLIGSVSLPMGIIHLQVPYLYMSCMYNVLMVAVSTSTSIASFLTMVTVSCERYLALFLHLRYSSLVNTKRATILALLIWTLVISIVAMMTGVGVLMSNLNILIFSMAPGMVVICGTYFKIFKLVRQHQRQIRAQSLCTKSHGASQGTKLAVTMAYVIGVSLLCYVPVGGVALMSFIYGANKRVAQAFYGAVILLSLSSLANPLIYCYRNQPIRRAVMSLLRDIINVF